MKRGFTPLLAAGLLFLLPVAVLAQAGFTFTHSGLEQSGAPGVVIVVNCELVNTGNAEDTFTIAFSNVNLPENWSLSICTQNGCSPPYPIITYVEDVIAAGASDATVTLDITPASDAVGDGSFTITITSGNDTGVSEDYDFVMHSTGVEEPDGELPLQATLEPAWPNPFNAQVQVAFNLPSRGAARIALYDPLGREVALLADGVFEAGRHIQSWSPATATPSGIYFVRFNALGAEQVQKVTLVR